MCPSPTAASASAATPEGAEARFGGESPASPFAGSDAVSPQTAARSPTDFSFGTTDAVRLPAIPPQAPDVTSQADAQALDDDFTFGTTNGLVLPDLSHVPKDCIIEEVAICAVSEKRSPPKVSLPRTSPQKQVEASCVSPQPTCYGHGAYDGQNQYNPSPNFAHQLYQLQQMQQVEQLQLAMNHWNHQAIYPHLMQAASPDYLRQMALLNQMQHIQSFQPTMDTIYSYASDQSGMLEVDAWSKPLPMSVVSSPEKQVAPENSRPQVSPAEAVGYVGDIETEGTPEMYDEDEEPSVIPELGSRPGWLMRVERKCKVFSGRSMAAAFCIVLLLLICIAVIVLIS